MDRRWDLVVLGALANICLGTVYSWSVFREPLVAAYGFTTAATGTPYSVFLALFAFSMPVGGWLQTRIGPRMTMAAGAVLVGAGWLSAGSVQTIAALSLTYGVIGGAGVGLAYGVPLAVVGSWFPRQRGLALGITLVGFGLSPFVTAPVAEVLLVRMGVAPTFRILGAAFVIVLFAATGFFRRAPAQPATTAAASQRSLTPKELFRNRTFYGLWLTFGLGTFAGLTAIGMSAAYGTEVVGISGPEAAAAVAAFGIFNGAGRPLFGWITDHTGARRAALLAFGVIIAGSLLAVFSQAQIPVLYLTGFALLWLTLGGWLAIAPAATAAYFGTPHYAGNYGVMYTAYGVGALSGGAASALLTSATGSLAGTFYAVLAAAAVGILLSVVLLPSRRQPTR